MAERCINLADWEARAMAEGQLSLLVRPMVQQPPADSIEVFTWEGPDVPGNKVEEGCYYRTERGLCFLAPFPARPGDVLVCRETWALHSMPYEGQGRGYVLQWKADRAERKVLFDGRVCPVGAPPTAPQPWPESAIDRGWRSPALMPKWAARHRRAVARVEARMVSSITDDEALVTGCKWCIDNPEEPGGDARDDFEGAWHDRYGKRYPWESSWGWFYWLEG